MKALMAMLFMISLILIAVTSVVSIPLQACALLGQQYPAPTQLSSNPVFQAATKHIEGALLSNSKRYHLNETTLSIGMFSIFEEDLLYQYHHTDALVAKSKQGTRTVDADSVYRIGSVSKLLTMLMFLIMDGDRHLSDPISEHVPELLKTRSEWNSITPNWSEITIGDLAGQMGGLARDYGASDLATPGMFAALPRSAQKAFPVISSSEKPVCGGTLPNNTFQTCSSTEFLRGIINESPVFPTAYTPAYSNEAFALIGIALQNMTNKTLEAIMNDAIVGPLGLIGTSSTVPNNIPDSAVIPGNALASGWSNELGAMSADGGFFSSTNDLARVGRAILNSTLLSKAVTNRWLKPSSFVEPFNEGVGRPWEIYRTQVNGQTVDLYTKAGDWDVYASVFVLVPQYSFGLTILVAADPGSASSKDNSFQLDFPNMLLPILLPALDQIARTQADSAFSGTYVDSKTQSSMTISTDPVNSGLLISNWTNNGVNLLQAIALETPDLVFRLQPNLIDYGNGKTGFTSYYTGATTSDSNTVVSSCIGWLNVDGLMYGNIPLGQMVFDLDSNGTATAVELRALRTTLKRSP